MLYKGKLAISYNVFTNPQINCIDDEISRLIDMLVKARVNVIAVKEVASI